MKPQLVCLLLIIVPVVCGAKDSSLENICHERTIAKHNLPEDSAHINRIVANIDRLSQGKEKTFNTNKTIDHRTVRELWKYFDDKQFSRIIITYTIDSTEYSVAYTEKYYLKEGALIYAYEREVLFLTNESINNGTTWAGDFYFSKGKLIDYVTLGHGMSELDDWDPEAEILQKLKSRKAGLHALK